MIYDSHLQEALLLCSTGAWPLLLALISIECSRSPEEQRRLLCFPVKSSVYPWVLAVVFTLIAQSFDVLLGTLLGHAYTWGYLEFSKLRPATAAAWEAGWASSLASLPGFVPAASAAPEGVSGATQQAAGWSRDNRQPATLSNGNGTAMMGSGQPGASAPPLPPPAAFPGGGRPLGAADTQAVTSGRQSTPVSAREKRAAAAAAAAARLQSGTSTAANSAPAQSAAAVSAPAAQRSVSAESSVYVGEEELSLLEAMGYARDQAANALQRAGGDVEAAMAALEEHEEQ